MGRLAVDGCTRIFVSLCGLSSVARVLRHICGAATEGNPEVHPRKQRKANPWPTRRTQRPLLRDEQPRRPRISDGERRPARAMTSTGNDTADAPHGGAPTPERPRQTHDRRNHREQADADAAPTRRNGCSEGVGGWHEAETPTYDTRLHLVSQHQQQSCEEIVSTSVGRREREKGAGCESGRGRAGRAVAPMSRPPHLAGSGTRPATLSLATPLLYFLCRPLCSQTVYKPSSKQSARGSWCEARPGARSTSRCTETIGIARAGQVMLQDEGELEL